METTSGVLEGLLALPDGGGSLSSMGERFQPDFLRGTGNYAVPLQLPAGPGGICPSLGLCYSTGAGNGSYGLGWRLTGLMDIRRRTDRGVPVYQDGEDEFMLGGDILVPVGGGRYRPRADRLNWHIAYEADSWTIRTKEGSMYELGTTEESRISQGSRVFSWLVDRETDAAGNTITYRYERDENAVYISEIAWSIYRVTFVYEPRPDPIHDGRAWFPIRTARRCVAIEKRCVREAQPLLAAYRLAYEEAEGSRLSLLREIAQTGYAADGETETFPPLKFTYTQFDAKRPRYKRVEAGGAPLPSLRRADTALVDMNGDGLPDILSTNGGRHRCWFNAGDGKFKPAKDLPLSMPGFEIGRRGVTFADLNGDGSADMFQAGSRLAVAIANTGAGTWAERPIFYREQPPLSVRSSVTRLVDMDGDGVVDLLQSGPGGFIVTYNRGANGWTRPQTIPRVADAEQFPDVSLDQAGVRLTDMNGDGLTDIAYIGSGRVEYWPSYGRGRWGKRVRMKNAPVFPANYRMERLFMTDIDGDGTADLIYVDFDKVYYWLNQSGIAWSGRYEIAFVPPPDIASLTVADLFGNGTYGMLWDASTRGGFSGYGCVDFSDGVKPYLLTEIDHGMGGLSRMRYTTTTALRKEDEAARRPWDSYLPFPIHVVCEIEHEELTSGRKNRMRMRYHRGYYDGTEREFRGFEQVEITTDGDAHTPTVVQEIVHMLGNVEKPPYEASVVGEAAARERALAGSPFTVRKYELKADGTRTLFQSAQMDWETRLDYADAARSRYVVFPYMAAAVTAHHAADSPDRIDAAKYAYDHYGNLTLKRRTGRFAGQPEANSLVTEQRIRYTDNEEAWLVGLPASIENRDGSGKLAGHTRNYYDGPAFTGLPFGQATRGSLRRSCELVLADWALPAGYADGIDPAWGLTKEAEGYYRTATSYAHDERGNVIVERDSLGYERTIEYDADFLFPLRLTDAVGTAAEADFDARTAQPLELRPGNGTVTRYRYSPLGRLTAQYDTTTDGTMQLTQAFVVDYGDFATNPARPARRPARVTSIRPLTPGQTPERFAGLDTAGLALLSDAGLASAYYDSEGNLLQQVSRGPDKEDGTARWVVGSRRVYTAQGQAAADYPNEFADSPAFCPPEAESSTIPVTFYYAANGQARRIEQPDGSVNNINYETDRIEKWDALTDAADTPIIERYNAWGYLTAVEQPDGAGNMAVTRYETDLFGRAARIVDPGGRVSAAYTYAGLGPAIRIVHADAGERTYWHDAAGRLRQRTDSLDRKLLLDYDALGRLITATDASDPANPTVIRRLTYTGQFLSEAAEKSFNTRFEYGGAGQIKRTHYEYADGATLTLENEYDMLGKPTAVICPNGQRIAYRFDQSGSVRGIADYVEHIDYDMHGSPLSCRFVGGVQLGYRYDTAMRRLLGMSLTQPSGAGTIRALDFTYDANGNIVTALDRLPGQTLARRYTYDRLLRLTQAESFAGSIGGTLLRDDRYAYTPGGDLLENGESLSGPMEYGDPTHAGRLTRVQSADSQDPLQLSYDEAGKVTAAGKWEDIRYDLWDRIVSVRLVNGTAVHFTYDHQGGRVEKRVESADATERTRYVGNLYEESSGKTRINVQLGSILMAVHLQENGESRVLCALTDHLGSLLTLCDQAGHVTHQQVYAPFGRALRVAGDVDRYTGATADEELDLLQFGARYYFPAAGRFITPDWFIIENPSRALRLPQGLNAYSYAINNPIMLRDPSGKWFGLDDLIVAGIGFVVGFVAGVIAGVAQGKSFGDTMLLALEGAALGAAGAWLAYNTFGAAAGLLGFGSGATTGIAVSAAIIGGLNGVISGVAQIYDWSSVEGWGAFLTDSTWGLVGTTMSLLVHFYNLCDSNSSYRPELSKRQNRHAYYGGFGFDGFAFTQGNVISNLNENSSADLIKHETLHVWQSRLFGPIFQSTYVAWLAAGTVVGIACWPFMDIDIGQAIMDVAYYDNPWEYWAYQVGGSTEGAGKLSYT